MVDVAWQDAVKEPIHETPTKEELKQHFGRRLINKWKFEFENRCWDSDQFAEASFHVLLGQLPAVKNIRITYENNISDTRVHLMLFQRSGTGKGRGFNFTVEMADLLDLECVSPDDTSDAKLVGRFKHVEGQREPVLVRGYLDPRRIPPVSILIQNEATLIIDARKTDFSKKFMNFYQKAMNPMGTADNMIEAGTIEMGEQEIRVNPTLSFYLTTYPPDMLLETISKTGFIQRMITLYNLIGYERRKESWETMAGKTGRVSERDEYIPEILAAMRHINKHYSKYPTVEMSTDTQNACNEVMRSIYRPLSKVNDAMREHLGDFVPRVYENVIKLSYHHAICRLSPLVENVDIGYGMKVILPSWTRLITFMEESDEIVRHTLKRWEVHRIRAYRVYDMVVAEQRTRGKETDGWVKRETMVKLLTTKTYGWDVSKQTVRSRLNKLTFDLKHFEEKTEEGVKKLRKRLV